MAGLSRGAAAVGRVRRLLTGAWPAPAGAGRGGRRGGRRGGQPPALPLDRSGADRFAPPGCWRRWRFLATLALALTLSLGGLVERWDRGLSGTLTVQLPAEGRPDRPPDGDRAGPQRARRQPLGSPAAEPVSERRAAELIEPWLGGRRGAARGPAGADPGRRADRARGAGRPCRPAPGAGRRGAGRGADRPRRLAGRAADPGRHPRGWSRR